jgi:hypothetical protein
MMTPGVSSLLTHITQEPFRELLKFKCRNFQFNGMASLYIKTQPKYRTRLKWQIFDAALEACSEESVHELPDIFAETCDPLNLLLEPSLDYLKGDVADAIAGLDVIADDEAVEHHVRRAAFFLQLVIKSKNATRAKCVSLREETRPSLLHFQFWDVDTPQDVAALMRRWNKETGAQYEFFSNERALTLIKEHFGADEVRAYHACRHPAAKSDLFRLCALYLYGGTYSDADTRPRSSFRTHRDWLVSKPTFWVATDVNFLPQTWFLSTPPNTRLYEWFICEATRRLLEDSGQQSIFNLAGPSLIADVMFARRKEEPVTTATAAYTNYFGEFNLMANVSPRYKSDPRSWQLFEGHQPKARNLFWRSLNRALATWG